MESLNHSHSSGFGPVLTDFMQRLFLSLASPAPEIAEPITKPETKPVTRPNQNDPFHFPLPAIDPTPKGFL